MDSKIDISIIIPVYNTELFKLKRCLESVKNFEVLEKSINKKCEVIAIDDGSDSYIEDFFKKYIKENKEFFSYYKKNNGGVSSARNMGIDNAKGEYICFVDSDDEMLFDNPLSISDFSKYDLILTDLIYITNNNSEVWNAVENDSGAVNNISLINKITLDGKTNGPVCKLIRLSFIKRYDIRFNEKIMSGEDLLFLVNILMHNPLTYYLNKITYKYYFDSNTSNGRTIHYPQLVVENNITMYISVMNLIEKMAFDDSKLKLQETERYIKQMFNIAADLSLEKKYSENKQFIKNAVSQINRKELANVQKNGSMKSWYEYMILKTGNNILFFVAGKLRIVYLRHK
jgi:glycosyltransferase involved in cell wall biosynthesis